MSTTNLTSLPATGTGAAEETQAQILRRGAEAWNAWRAENPYRTVDLSNHKFEGRRAQGNRSWAQPFRRPAQARLDLTRADLSNAKLNSASFRGVILCDATFDGADLAGTDLREYVVNTTGSEG